MSPSNPGTKVTAAVAAIALVVAGCGGADDSSSREKSPPSPNTAVVGPVSDEVEAAAAEAHSLGLQFARSHEEIIAAANEEGSLIIQTSMAAYEPFQEAFAKAYPNLDTQWVEMGDATTQRFLLEVESGVGPRYDIAYVAPEAYNDIAEMTDWDLLGMAQAGILDIPIEMIDSEKRTVISPGSSGIALVYNKNLVSEAELPKTWQEVADPKWSRDQLGIAMDVDLNNVGILASAPGWDLDKVLELSAQLAELDPIFTNGHTAATLLVQNGEVAMSPFVNLHSAVREVDKNPDGALQVALIEPVPVRLAESAGVFNADFSDSPHAALLFIEWMASDDFQSLLDADPLQASLHWEGSRMADMIGDRKIGVFGSEMQSQLPDWVSQVQATFGFPTAG